MLKRQRRRRQHSGEAVRARGAYGPHPRLLRGAGRALGGGLGWGRGALVPPGREAATIRLPASPTRRRDPRGALGRACIPAHPRAPCIPAPARAPGEGRARGAEEGAPQAWSLGKSRPRPVPSLRADPEGTRAVTPQAPLASPPIGSPLFSADRSPGKGEGVLRSPLKGPSPLLVSRQVASTSGVGRAHGPPPPSSPPPSSGAAAGPAGQGSAAHPLRCVLQPARPTRTPCEAGTGGTGTPPSAGAVGGADPRPGEQPRRSQAQGLGRSRERRGPAGRRRASRLARASWVTGPAWLAGKK